MTIQSPGWLRRYYSGRRLMLFVVFALLVAAALHGWLPFIYAPSYTPKTLTALPAQRTTHCLGRYLIDLPSNFELHTGGWGNIHLYYGLDRNFERVYATVKNVRYTNETFWKEVNIRRFELNDQINDMTKEPVLLHSEQINTTTALLRHLGDKIYALSIKTEVHVLVGHRYVILEEESYSKDQMSASYKSAEPEKAETRLKLIASKLLPYENAEHAKPGFCMQGVLFDVGQDDEVASFDFRTKDLPDLNLTVDYHAVTGQPSEGILKRRQEAYQIHPAFLLSVATMRKGKTRLADVPAEQSLTKITQPITQHNFIIERRDNAPFTLNRPHFGISLTTGNEYQTPIGEEERKRAPYTDKSFYLSSDKAMVYRADNSVLSDAQVLKLWDDMVASVRKR